MLTKIIIDDTELTETEAVRALDSLLGKHICHNILFCLKLLAHQKKLKSGRVGERDEKL
jgi:hypothetical protein